MYKLTITFKDDEETTNTFLKEPKTDVSNTQVIVSDENKTVTFQKESYLTYEIRKLRDLPDKPEEDLEIV